MSYFESIEQGDLFSCYKTGGGEAAGSGIGEAMNVVEEEEGELGAVVQRSRREGRWSRCVELGVVGMVGKKWRRSGGEGRRAGDGGGVVVVEGWRRRCRVRSWGLVEVAVAQRGEEGMGGGGGHGDECAGEGGGGGGSDGGGRGSRRGSKGGDGGEMVAEGTMKCEQSHQKQEQATVRRASLTMSRPIP